MVRVFFTNNCISPYRLRINMQQEDLGAQQINIFNIKYHEHSPGHFIRNTASAVVALRLGVIPSEML